MRNLQILARNYVNYCFNLTVLYIFMVINTSLCNSALKFPSMVFELGSQIFKASLNNRLENTPVLKKSNHKVRLGKHMGMFTCIVITIGSIIGTGIFISPKGILMNVGSLGMSLVVWILCGLISFLGSSVFIELGACLPQSGGTFIYLKTAFGELLAFLYLWMTFLIEAPSTLTILNLTFSNYMLAPLFKDCSPPTGIINVVAALPICFLTFVNCYKVQWATRAQGVFVLTKVLALASIITAGLVHLIKGNTQNFHSVFQDTNANPGFIALAFYSGLYSYSGWNILNTMTEELKNPFENLPKAAFISLAFVTLIYTLTNAAYFMVLTPNEIMSSNAIAVTFGNRVFGILSWIMQIFVALSTFGNVNAMLISISRLLFVGAREGHLPNILSMVNVDHLTPVPSLLFLCTVSLCYLCTNEVYVLMNFAVFAGSIFNGLTAAALLWLRYKQPDLERPIKVNIIIPIAYFCVCVFLTAMPMYVRPLETGKGAAIILSGIPVYYGTVFWVNKPKMYLHVIKKLTHVVQILSVSMPEETFECEKKAKTETDNYINYSGLNKSNE